MKKVKFNFIVSEEERELMTTLAEAAGISASDVLRLALREYAKKRKAA